ncbi:MAG: exosortase/archaeosortase family protein [Bacteroidales bacterium]|nr:exosortase/archaeosortase family protein [Bacteroidales bacterium]
MKLMNFVQTKLNKTQRQSLKDIALFMLATIIFHFLYWNTNMDSWLFGSFTNDVYDFFTNIAFNVSKWVMGWLFSTDFVTHSRTFFFYHLDVNGIKQFFESMSIVPDCSGVKQMMQVFIFMIFVPGKVWKRLIYWLCCCLIIIALNAIRIIGLTGVLIWHYGWFQLVHDWIGRPFMYVFIFMMWVLWIEKFGRRKTDNKSSQHTSAPPEED